MFPSSPPSASTSRVPTRRTLRQTFPRSASSPAAGFSEEYSQSANPRFNFDAYMARAQSRDVVMVDGTSTTVSLSQTVTRPSSPTPTMDFSMISPPSPLLRPDGELDVPQVDVFAYGGNGTTPSCSSFFATNGSRNASRRPSPSRSGGKSPLARFWDVLASPGKKGKGKANQNPSCYVSTFNYSELPPLDGEEGELIDEACYIDVMAVTGIDILSRLPPEIALHLLLFLDLPSILACLSVSRTWRALAKDNGVWKGLFEKQRSVGWAVDLAGARSRGWDGRTYVRGNELEVAPLTLDWRELYKTRLEVDKRWATREPRVTRIAGHTDSVYCLEFDSQRIITGSRDRTIKVWSLRTGKLMATFRGHMGSVLCLKFDKDWDVRGDWDDAEPRRGFMVSGSSDCSVCVWDLWSLKGQVRAEVRAVLRGHTGGVLDIRIDQKWIVSCSKDAIIRVWNRESLSLHQTLRGHEGPVNAVGLQGERAVSASGDGKMIMWDINNGERLRTFEGHDRGLACIEFKGDLIVSGSNDCKIKVWSAATGECLLTLVGHDLLVRALSFDPASGRLVSASYDRSVKVWDLKTGKMVREFKNSHVSHIFDVKFDACRIVSTSHDQKIVVLDFSQDLDTTLFV